MKSLVLLVSHLIALGVGFALGIYTLPILVAPEAPSGEAVQAQLATPRFTGSFRRDLKDSDALHWGEGQVLVSDKRIGLVGELAPGPDYRLYLAPEFVETESDFMRIRHSMVQVGDVKTFKNFLVAVPEGIAVGNYNTVVIWCERFDEFITAARYR